MKKSCANCKHYWDTRYFDKTVIGKCKVKPPYKEFLRDYYCEDWERKNAIHILGQEYKIVWTDKEECKDLEKADGVIDYYKKEITMDKELLNDEDDLYKNQVLRHEIIHAFLHESGMTKYRTDETLVELLSFQIPKMVKTFEELDIC